MSREIGRERDGFVYETDPLHCCHYHATGGRSIVLCLSVSEKLIVLNYQSTGVLFILMC